MHSSNEGTLMITVFYDDRCRLCSKEIAFYQKISADGYFCWVGISSNQETLERLNISLVDALMYLHVKDSNGSVLKGVNAFITIWRRLPYFRWLSFVISLPIIFHLSSLFYTVFAKYRFARLPHCQTALTVNNRKL
jgi:predicted DCC family thiol-disulfide oxidoreductase YuxK